MTETTEPEYNVKISDRHSKFGSPSNKRRDFIVQ